MARKTRQAFPVTGPTTPAEPATGNAVPAGITRKPMFMKGAASHENAAKSAAAEERMFRNLSVDLIDPSPVQDRIDLTENIEDLKRSLAEQGQQIPILVRPKPDSDRFEIVTGRRRLLATRQLGHKTIQAFVRRMSDEEAFVAQGVENNDRLETSFIERSRTIAMALDAGFTQMQVQEFLGVDQSITSRMKSIYSSLGEDLVVAIGPARGVGRRKWEQLQKLVAESGRDPKDLVEDVPMDIDDSAERFEAFLRKLEGGQAAPKVQRASPAARVMLADGKLSARRKSRQFLLRVEKDMPEEFFDFLEASLPDLVTTFTRQRSAKQDK